MLALAQRPHTTPMPGSRRLHQSHSTLGGSGRSCGQSRDELSATDVMIWAERQRQNASRNSLRAAVEAASTRGLKATDRPKTTGGIQDHARTINAPKHVPVTKVIFRDQPPKPGTPSTDVQLWGVDDCDKQLPTTRQTCEVLGPAACGNCRRLRVRRDNVQRSEQTFPALFTSDDNFTTSTRLQRYFPELTEEEIKLKLNKGDICHHTLKDQVESTKNSRDYYVSSRVSVQEPCRRNKMVSDDGVTVTYFSNLIQLNERIFKGQADRHRGFKPAENFIEETDELAGFRAKSTASQRGRRTSVLFPSFVSNKRRNKPKAPSYITHFDPPLIPRAQQRCEPSFFAGTDIEYELPDKLPDKIISDDLENEVERQLARVREEDEKENITAGELVRSASENRFQENVEVKDTPRSTDVDDNTEQM